MTDRGWEAVTSGIADSYFIRGQVPMTKQEVRAVVLSQLQLKSDSIIYDLGAGTGSVSIEMAFRAHQGKVWAVERNPKGIELITQNAKHFGIKNLEIVEGLAPQVLERLPLADRVFIGGSGGKLQEILVEVDRKLVAGGRVVVTANTVRTVTMALETMEKLGYILDGILLQTSRLKKRGNSLMWEGQNPIQIIIGSKERVLNNEVNLNG